MGTCFFVQSWNFDLQYTGPLLFLSIESWHPQYIHLGITFKYKYGPVCWNKVSRVGVYCPALIYNHAPSCFWVTALTVMRTSCWLEDWLFWRSSKMSDSIWVSLFYLYINNSHWRTCQRQLGFSSTKHRWQPDNQILITRHLLTVLPKHIRQCHKIIELGTKPIGASNCLFLCRTLCCTCLAFFVS